MFRSQMELWYRLSGGISRLVINSCSNASAQKKCSDNYALIFYGVAGILGCTMVKFEGGINVLEERFFFS